MGHHLKTPPPSYTCVCLFCMRPRLPAFLFLSELSPPPHFSPLFLGLVGRSFLCVNPPPPVRAPTHKHNITRMCVCVCVDLPILGNTSSRLRRTSRRSAAACRTSHLIRFCQDKQEVQVLLTKVSAGRPPLTSRLNVPLPQSAVRSRNTKRHSVEPMKRFQLHNGDTNSSDTGQSTWTPV